MKQQRIARLPKEWPFRRGTWSLAACALLLSACTSRDTEPVGRRPEAAEAPRTAVVRRTAPDPQEYAGSERCAECHAEIAEQYDQTHSMAHAMAPIGAETIVEDYSHGLVRPPGNREYHVERSEDTIVHRELTLDAEGEAVFDLAVPVAFAVGSGRRGRSYVIDRDGLYFQSPVSWYTQQQQWDLAPGYRPHDHQRFDRRIRHECLYCHAGRIEIADRGNHRFDSLVEGGIGCERCHGPGMEHVRRQSDGWEGADDSIVNPVRLAPAERDSVCFQCHLRTEFIFARSDADYDAFVPGLRYEDNWAAFVKKEAAEDKSLVQQFRASRCFQASDGALGCITCHDPHRRPDPAERAAFYEQRCLTCHEEQGCSRPASQQNGTCIGCHMPSQPTQGIPHTALTDHRILRTPAPTKPRPVASSTPPELVLFESESGGLPARQRERAWGILAANAASLQGDHRVAHSALTRLGLLGKSSDEVLAAIGNDVKVLEKAGVPLAMHDQPETALACWKKALELEPNNEPSLHALCMFYLRVNEPQMALPYARRLVEANPHSAEYRFTLAQTLQLTGQTEQALEEAETALAGDPAADPLRRWVIEQYDAADKGAAANGHRLILDRLKRR